ncbi:hypothetical protein KCU74_g74, partial [Aureobasidium melanogenum]
LSSLARSSAALPASSPKISSISSRVRPLVSGTMKKMKAAARKQMIPKKMKVPEVVEPVRRGTDRDTLCSDTEGEDFSDEDPCTRLKEVSEVDLVDPNKDDGDPTSG